MVKTLNTPEKVKQSKSISKPTQLQTIFEYLQNNVATASMASNETGIAQKCITRYKRDLEKNSMLWETEKKICKLTGFKAWYITTNPNLAPAVPSQLKMF
jgi:hypothetical protein